MRGRAFGIYVELELEDGVRLAFNDGVSVRLMGPKDQAACPDTS